jgi:hypothetical protein
METPSRLNMKEVTGLSVGTQVFVRIVDITELM